MARKILLADDSVTAQNMGRRILSDAGYEVITVNNGSAALKKIPDEKPDLVILDVYMPGYGGLEVCQRLKDLPATAHIPVLLTVGKLEPFKAEEARKVHADGHLVKPFEASELLAALTKLEDKIVPLAEPRGAKAKERPRSSGFEAPDVPAPTAKEKASEVTGPWKNRLKISTKLPDAEGAKEPAPRRAAFRSIDHPAVAVAPAETAPAPTNGLVGNITAEELAAIAAAAAAAFEEKSEPAVAAPSVEASEVATHVVEEAVAPAPVESRMEAPAPEYAEPVSDAPQEKSVFPERANPYGAIIAAAVVEEPAVAEAAPTAEALPAFETSIEATAVSVEAPQAQIEQASEESAASEEPPARDSRKTMQSAIYSSLETSDPDLAAALESLAPVHVDTPGDVDSYVSLIERISETAGASASAVAGAAGRWRAEEVALSQEEASCVLEQEMDQVYAHLRAERMMETPIDLVSEIVSPLVDGHAHAAEVAEEAAPVTAQTWAEMAWAEAGSASDQHPHEALIAASYADRTTDDYAPTEPAAVASEFGSPDQAVPVAESELVAEAAAMTEEVSHAAHETTEVLATAETVEAVSSEPSFTENAAETAVDPVLAEQLEEPVAAVASAETQLSEPAIAEAPAPAMLDSMIAAVDENIAAENRPEAAFAAAASASYGFRTITHDEPVAEPESRIEDKPAEPVVEAAIESTAPVEEVSAAPAAEEVPPQRAAELAQAWAHWKQIRDSVASPQFTAKVAAAAVELQEARQEAAAAAAPAPASQSEAEAAEAEADADPLAIASIVDSVLADLRPKLVAEIARKLNKEKKEKK